MTQELASMMLLGAAIAVVSSLATLFVHHRLTLRRDKLQRQRDRQDVAILWQPENPDSSAGRRVVALGRYLQRRDGRRATGA